MIMRTVSTFSLACFFYFANCCPLVAADRPNVILIMTDNHGAWTLGCYGNQDIRTPHIDSLAAEGTLFTRAFASNPVCSPTRATFLTGLLPSQHGVHCFLRAGRLQVGPNARNTLEAFRSLPEILQSSGYACGLVGKWHLGANVSPQEGFDDYWITMPHGGTSTFYDAQIIENGAIRKEPKYLTEFWTDHAVRFIRQQTDAEKPFFLMLAYNGPYALSRLLLREGKNRHAEYYADKTLPSFPREPTHPWQYSNRDYHNHLTSIRRVATEVSGIDDGVGRVLQTLKTNGIDDNTLIIFVADQGWVGGHGGFFGMGDHTRPVTGTDGMMRIPMIWRHPGNIRAAESDLMVTNYDFLPTLLSYLELDDQAPVAPRSPGRDFSKELVSESDLEEVPVFYEFENLRCVRTEHWKYIHRHPNGPHELYDLAADPDEFNNLADDPQHAARRLELKGQLDAFFRMHATPKYDLWQGGESQTALFVGIDEETAQRAPAPPPPLPDHFAPATIEVPDGFSVELVAGAPLVKHPTLACLDDSGRLFVCDNAGVNFSAEELEKELPNSIKVLEDTDQDGRFDKSTVFADDMTYPMGGTWHDGSLYVASPPNIWRLKDTDGDNVADEREIIVGQFGYTGNAASIHGCFMGPEGRLYWCDGYHGHEFRDEDGTITSRREGSYIFSSRVDGSDVRLHCGGGMDNPVEVDFTDTGEMLGTVNILYSRPRVDALVHWLHGGAYPHRERVLGEIKTTGELLGPVHRFGHVAVSGVTRYRSGTIDHRWRDNLFATFFNAGKVVRLETERDGASFRVRQREFLTGTSPDFHPTDVLEDADGSLLVIDTGGWFYRGCPTSQMAKPDVLGGIYRIARDGMTPLNNPWGKGIRWNTLPMNEAIALMNDSRFKVRQRAIAELASRGSDAVPALAQAARRDIRVRAGAIWALARIVADEASDPARAAIRRALDDDRAEIRQIACQAIATYPDPLAVDGLIKRLREDVAPVRREAAKALGRIGNQRAAAPLLNALDRQPSIDRSEQHAITYALIEINHPPSILFGLEHPSPAVRQGTLIALDQMESDAVRIDAVVRQLASPDAGVRRTALDILARKSEGLVSGHATSTYRKQIMADVTNHLDRWLADPRAAERFGDDIRSVASAFYSVDSIAQSIGRGLARPELRQVLLDALRQAQVTSLHPSWTDGLESLLQSDEDSVLEPTISVIARMKSDRFRETLKRIGYDESRSALLRIAALRALQTDTSRMDNDSFSLALKTLAGDAPTESTRTANLLAGLRLSSDQRAQLIDVLADVGPQELRDLSRLFSGRQSPEVAKRFLDAVASHRYFDRLAMTEFSDVVKRYPEETLPQANELLGRLRMRDERRAATVDQVLSMIDNADPSRGRELFFAEKAKCGTCHQVRKQGGEIGPNLSTIGANRSEQDLLESILFPSASIVRQYESYSVLTHDGRVFTGTIARETTRSLFVQPQTGEPIRIDHESIERIAPADTSLMPSGIDEVLSNRDIADVVAWLRSLQ